MSDFDDFSNIMSMAAQAINGAAGVVGSTFGLGDTKELYDWTHERNQNWMLQDPSKALAGLQNAGLSPVAQHGPMNFGGSSGAGNPLSPIADSPQRQANFAQAIMNMDQLKTNQATRDLLNAQAEKEMSQAHLFESQKQGQDISNTDYQGAMNTGGILGNQSIGQFLSNDYTVDSNATQKLYNRLNRMVVLGQINDPVVVQALTSLPEKEVKEIITRTANYAQDILVGKSQVKLNGALGFQATNLGRLYNAQWKGQMYTNNHILPNQRNSLILGNRPFGRNPYSLEGAITDFNEFWKQDSFLKGLGMFGRGLGNYILNAIPSLMGPGVQWSNTNRMSNTMLNIANMKNNQDIITTHTSPTGKVSSTHTHKHVNNKRRFK